jgi:antitoxin (DNA-binding transcriptional repressor) of toxin-antitoxin stability system
MTNTISKSKLRAKMFDVFRELEASGEELIVTDHGKPVLKIFPIKDKTTVEELFGDLQGLVSYFEDVDTPTLPEWEEI